MSHRLPSLHPRTPNTCTSSDNICARWWFVLHFHFNVAQPTKLLYSQKKVLPRTDNCNYGAVKSNILPIQFNSIVNRGDTHTDTPTPEIAHSSCATYLPFICRPSENSDSHIGGGGPQSEGEYLSTWHQFVCGTCKAHHWRVGGKCATYDMSSRGHIRLCTYISIQSVTHEWRPA